EAPARALTAVARTRPRGLARLHARRPGSEGRLRLLAGRAGVLRLLDRARDARLRGERPRPRPRRGVGTPRVPRRRARIPSATGPAGGRLFPRNQEEARPARGARPLAEGAFARRADERARSPERGVRQVAFSRARRDRNGNRPIHAPARY